MTPSHLTEALRSLATALAAEVGASYAPADYLAASPHLEVWYRANRVLLEAGEPPLDDDTWFVINRVRDAVADVPHMTCEVCDIMIPISLIDDQGEQTACPCGRITSKEDF